MVKIIFSLAALMFSGSALAAVSPVSISVVKPVQFPPSDFSVTGLRMSLLWGQQRDVYGLDLGVLGNITEQDFAGIGLAGVFNWTKGTTNVIGLQAAGAANINTNKARVIGLQVALGANVNTAESSVAGLQLALVNLAQHTDIYGVQVGIYNRADSVYGFQIGLINEVQNLHGLQIGLLNFYPRGLFSVSPIINFGF